MAHEQKIQETGTSRRADEPIGAAPEVLENCSRDITNLELVGGRLCLDFVNTVEARLEDGQQRVTTDYLTNYDDLVCWCGHVGLLTREQQMALMRIAARHPDVAQDCFERAIELREALCRVFSALASGGSPAAADMALVQNAYRELMEQAHLTVTRAGVGLAWQWPSVEETPEDQDDLGQLEHLVWPVVRSAVELLTAPEMARVKICPGVGDCGWLFLDTSKNGRRRWCSMESCGSRVKMRRYYARTHAGDSGDSGESDT